MSIMVRFGRQKAFFRQGEWFSADPQLEEELNRVTNSWIQETGGPPLEDRDHEQTVVRTILEKRGGRIVLRTPPSAKKSAEIYISRRQLDFDF